jgi:hypothetical protein
MAVPQILDETMPVLVQAGFVEAGMALVVDIDIEVVAGTQDGKEVPLGLGLAVDTAVQDASVEAVVLV